jgi:alpha-beta hydrolase superfamily lysophospholipase
MQIAHGLAAHSGRYARLAETLTDTGYAVYASGTRRRGSQGISKLCLPP